MRTHPKINPAIAKGLKAVRAQFTKRPDSYNGKNPCLIKGCGCIVAWLREKVDSGDDEACYEWAARFPANKAMLNRLFDQSAGARNCKSAAWAIKRIDKALATNT